MVNTMAHNQSVDLAKLRKQLVRRIPSRQRRLEEIAAACAFLSWDRASFIAGQTILIVGGVIGSL